MKEIQGNSVLIAGFGREGQAVLNYLCNNYKGLDIRIADKDPARVKNLKFPVFSGGNYLDKADKFDTIIRSPGITKNHPALKKAKYVTTATNIFFSECKGKTIGVTGTKGKSTTSSLIYHILKGAGKNVKLAGNIGEPALNALSDSSRKTIFVIELSSYQLDDLRYSPNIAVILPIYKEHINYHVSFRKYLEAKKNIVKSQSEQDCVIYYSPNHYSSEIANAGGSIKIPYQNKNKLKLYGSKLIPSENISAAITVAEFLQVQEEKIRKAVQSFIPLKHRLENIGTYKGITFYNDSLATIPEAAIYAISALGENLATLIAGGFDRGISYKKLGKAIARSPILNLILLPDTGEKIKSAVKKADPFSKINFISVDNMENAVRKAYELTPSGKICLLSPASASFNLFKNYEERGNCFINLVKSIEKE